MDTADSASNKDTVAKIVINQPGIKPQTLLLNNGDVLRVGRSNDNDIVIFDGNVSRFHAILNASSLGVMISDLGSLNGTFINNKKINIPTNLCNNDEITVGSATINFFLLTADVDTTAGRPTIQTQRLSLDPIEVTIVVADICGYTTLSEKLPAKDIATTLNKWFAKMEEIIIGYGGEVDKYIGDCVMAIWKSSQQTPEERALNATKAGIDILNVTKEFAQSEDWPHRETDPWVARIAVNSGKAIMGTLGGRDFRDFTVLGDSVNVAFRLEKVAKAQGVYSILSHSTAVHLNDKIPVTNLGKVDIEGKKEQIEVFTLA